MAADKEVEVIESPPSVKFCGKIYTTLDFIAPTTLAKGTQSNFIKVSSGWQLANEVPHFVKSSVGFHGGLMWSRSRTGVVFGLATTNNIVGLCLRVTHYYCGVRRLANPIRPALAF